MSGFTLTPNVGLQVPNFNQPNWNVPTNYNWFLLDTLFAGTLALSNYAQEAPGGSIPGTVFELSENPVVLMAVFVNGLFQRPGGLDYTLSGKTITFNAALQEGDTLYALYFK